MSEAARDPRVRAVFAAYPPALREALDELRLMILEAAHAADVELVEALKWGQPAYLPATPRTGTTVRIDAVRGSVDRYALYVNCKTSLLDSFRLLYPDLFAFEGQRGLIFSTAEPPPDEAPRHCLTLALTYHRKR